MASHEIDAMLVGQRGDQYYFRYIDEGGCSRIYPSGRTRPRTDGMKPYAMFTSRTEFLPYLDTIADGFVRKYVKDLDEQLRVNRFFSLSEIIDAGRTGSNLAFIVRRVNANNEAIYLAWLINPDTTMIAKRQFKVDLTVNQDVPVELNVDIHMDPEDALIAFEVALRQIWRTVMEHVRDWT